ncbi:MAG: DUF4258 domain-containing protein, partial [Patescibacteria group bacterium]
WTNHAIERMRERGIKQGDAWLTWRRPDSSRHSKSRGAWVYYRTFPSTSSGQAQKIEVVAKKNEKKKWIILSVWSRDVSRVPRSTGSRHVYTKKRKREKKSLGALFLDSLLGRRKR